MYCVECGVELSGSEKKCPLCGTPVATPAKTHDDDAERTYPPFTETHEEFNKNGILFILTFLFILPLSICFLSDFGVNGQIEWFGYVCGAVIFGYTVMVLPLWFRSPNPIIFLATDFLAAALFLFYIDYQCGGNWFLTFALPLTAALGVFTLSILALIRYLKKGLLFIYSGAFIIGGGLFVLTEFLLNLTFGLENGLVWCLYPLLVFFIIGVMLMIIALSRPLRESLHKKFFI